MAKELKEKKIKAPKQKKLKAPKQMIERKQSRVWETLKKEYTFENWLLAVLAPILLLYGVYIVMGKFGTVPFSNLGSTGVSIIDFFFNSTLKRVLTGSFLILIGLLVIIYLFIPYVKPSISEMKKVSWPTTKILAENTAKVFTFLLFLTAVFLIYGFALDPLFKWLYS